MPGHTLTRAEAALQNLRALLEVNSEIARSGGLDAPSVRANPEVARVVDAVSRSAGLQRDELQRLIHEWERHHVRVLRERPAAPARTRASTREIIESWIDIKQNAASLYRRAADDAPTVALRARLIALAEEEELHCERLRRLL